MIFNERQLAKAIMNKETLIDMHPEMVSGVQKIKNPSPVVWYSVAAALVSSAFFWANPGAAALSFATGLPAILAVCGGVGGVVFVTLGASGTICAFRLLMIAHSMDVLNDLRDKYELKKNMLIRK